jgi:hypothetical protein
MGVRHPKLPTQSLSRKQPVDRLAGHRFESMPGPFHRGILWIISESWRDLEADAYSRRLDLIWTLRYHPFRTARERSTTKMNNLRGLQRRGMA